MKAKEKILEHKVKEKDVYYLMLQKEFKSR